MKYFIKKILLFMIPPAILLITAYFISTKYYTISGGDLNRIGKIPFKEDYRNFQRQNIKKKYNNLTDLDLNRKNKIDILVIGDSFTLQGDVSFVNYLANLSDLNVVNFNIQNDPLQTLYNITNGNLFDNLEVRYIVLSKAQRVLLNNININQDNVYNTDDLIDIWDSNRKNISEKELPRDIINDTYKFFIYSILYNFDDNAFNSDVYKMDLTKELFSDYNDEIIFFYQDLKSIDKVDKNNINKLNSLLNKIDSKLKQKKIELIVLPCPDKYDIYYTFIKNNPYPKNLFFNYMDETQKNYYFINTKNILKKYLDKGEVDLYLADDTHWSYKSAKIAAKSILSIINNR